MSEPDCSCRFWGSYLVALDPNCTWHRTPARPDSAPTNGES